MNSRMMYFKFVYQGKDPVKDTAVCYVAAETLSEADEVFFKWSGRRGKGIGSSLRHFVEAKAKRPTLQMITMTEKG